MLVPPIMSVVHYLDYLGIHYLGTYSYLSIRYYDKIVSMIIRHLFTPATVKCSRNIYNDRVIEIYICYSENDSEMGGHLFFFLADKFKETPSIIGGF